MSTSSLPVDGDSVAQAFCRAEKMLKRFERISDKTLSSAINQLRYAGRHLIEADAAEGDVQDDLLRKAIAHCHRAEFDAIDAAIAFVGRNIAEYNGRYLQESMTTVIPRYADYYSKAVLLLEEFRVTDSARDVGLDELGVYGTKLDELVKVWVELDSKRPLVEKFDYEKRMMMKIGDRRHLTNTLLAIMGILATLFFGIIAKWF